MVQCSSDLEVHDVTRIRVIVSSDGELTIMMMNDNEVKWRGESRRVL